MSKGEHKAIVRTASFRSDLSGDVIKCYIKLSKGPGWIEHNPFPANAQGMVAMFLLAADVQAGKFYPMRLMSDKGEPLQLEDNSDDN